MAKPSMFNKHNVHSRYDDSDDSGLPLT